MNKLKERILEISKKKGLSHIGSCLNSVDIIQEIYKLKSDAEPFCLGNSHAFLALAVVLEYEYGYDAEKLSDDFGTHAKRSINPPIWVSGGSLGLVEPIAAGLAFYKKTSNVYLLSSDGGMMEDIPWSVLRFKAENKLDNLKWYISCNGYGAYRKINYNKLRGNVHSFDKSVKLIKTNSDFSNIKGLNAHYAKIC